MNPSTKSLTSSTYVPRPLNIMIDPSNEAEGAEMSADGKDVGSVDWSSLEEVSSHVSRATLAGMQQLWRQHAAGMDAQGKAFAQQVYTMHAQTIKEVTSMRSFELKPVMTLLNTFTSGIREAVLDIFQNMRRQDDEFAQHMYQTSRRTFTQNLKSALEARDVFHQDKVLGFRQQHESALMTVRSAAASELRQRELQLQAENTTLRNALQQLRKQLPDQVASNPPLSDVGGGGRGAGIPDSNQQIANMKLAAMEIDLLLAGKSKGDDASGSQVTFEPTSGGMADGSAGALEDARAALSDLKSKADTLTIALQFQKGESSSWRNKWAKETAKAEGTKRECLQIITKCEDHVKMLQQQHLAELGQRDYILQRCRDTILNLEARITELSGSPPTGSQGSREAQHLHPQQSHPQLAPQHVQHTPPFCQDKQSQPPPGAQQMQHAQTGASYSSSSMLLSSTVDADAAVASSQKSPHVLLQSGMVPVPPEYGSGWEDVKE